MEITEVRIKLMDELGERLQAFCSITFDDCFVIRDLKIIEGANGPFVAMPSRKLTSHCPQCGSKNHLRAAHCNHCGLRLRDDREIKDTEGRAKLYADIAHPINSDCREMIQNRVIKEFRNEMELSKQPDYVSYYDDFDASDEVFNHSTRATHRQEPSVEASHVQPAAREPRPPHSSSSTSGQPTKRHDAVTKEVRVPKDRSEATDSGFGAGIF